MNILHYQTLIASKAVRMVLAAPHRLLIDFGLRRAHGSEAGLLAARASFIAGFSGTATVIAGAKFGIPVNGTMTHSFIQAHETEEAAFLAFARVRPKQLILLIDTFDTITAAAKVVRIAPTLKAEGIRAFASDQLSRLPKSLRGPKSSYSEGIAPALRRLRDECAKREASLWHSNPISPSG